MARSVTIKHLRAFASVARLRSFTRAAEAAHLSQPSLTMAVRQLEEIVGARLLDRTTRGVSLTTDGGEFLPTAERLLHDFDAAVRDLRATARRRRDHVSVAAVHSVATRVLPVAIQKLAAARPGVGMYLRDGNSADVCRRVRDDEVDVGFGSVEDDDGELVATPLFRDRMGVIGRVQHTLFRTERTLVWQDLGAHDFIGLAPDTATKPILDRIAHLPESVVAPRFEVSNNTTLWAMVDAGNGITSTPALAIPERAGRRLRFRPLAKPKMWRTVHSITRRARATSPVAREFIEIVRARIAEIAARDPLVEAL